MEQTKHLILFLSYLLFFGVEGDVITEKNVRSLPSATTAGGNTVTSSISSSTGEFYVAGRFTSTNDFGGISASATGSSNGYLAKYGTDLSLSWLQVINSTFGDTALLAVTVDSNGNVVTGGYQKGIVNYGGTNYTTLGTADATLVKYTSSGTVVFAKNFGISGSAATTNTQAVANFGLVSGICAQISGSTTNFGGNNMTTTGYYDLVFAQYSSTGSHQWSLQLAGSSQDEGCGGAAYDSAGNFYATGYFKSNSISISGLSASRAGTQDFFLVKISAAGTATYLKNWTSIYTSMANSIAVDSLDNIIITGYFNTFNNASLNFGGTPMQTLYGAYDAFVVKLNSTADFVWQVQIGGGGDTKGTRVLIGTDNSVYVSGSYQGSPYGMTLPSVVYGAFIGKYASDSTAVWAYGYNSTTNAWSTCSMAIATNVSRVYFASPYKNNATTASGTITTYSTSTTYSVLTSNLETIVPSPSVTPSPSTTPTPSKSPTPSRTPSPSISPTTSVTPSTSPTASVTPSTSPSVSPSTAPTYCPTIPAGSAPPSPPPSGVPPPCVPASTSPTPSATPSVSPSVSITPSVTPSSSPSVSPSVTPSPVSPSVTPSPVPPSVTPSASPSVSPSPIAASSSPSVSPIAASASPSMSPIAASTSPSVSPSPIAASTSPSPSAGPAMSSTPSATPAAASESPSPSISQSPTSNSPSPTISVAATPSASSSPSKSDRSQNKNSTVYIVVGVVVGGVVLGGVAAAGAVLIYRRRRQPTNEFEMD